MSDDIVSRAREALDDNRCRNRLDDDQDCTVHGGYMQPRQPDGSRVCSEYPELAEVVQELADEVEEVRSSLEIEYDKWLDAECAATKWAKRAESAEAQLDHAEAEIAAHVECRERQAAEIDRLRVALTDECRDIAVGSIETAEAIGAHREVVAETMIRVGYPSVRAERDQLRAAVERVRGALDRVVLDHRYTGEPTSPGYQGAADYIRAALDGDNQSGDRSPDWYDTHCPTCDAPKPTHTPTCAVVHHQSGDPS